MSNFQWIGNNSIIYKGRVCSVKGEWGVVDAMNRIDREEQEREAELRAKIKAEILAELKEDKE